MALPVLPLEQAQLVPKEQQGQLVPLEPKELLARQGRLELPVLLERLRLA